MQSSTADNPRSGAGVGSIRPSNSSIVPGYISQNSPCGDTATMTRTPPSGLNVAMPIAVHRALYSHACHSPQFKTRKLEFKKSVHKISVCCFDAVVKKMTKANTGNLELKKYPLLSLLFISVGGSIGIGS